MKRFFAVFHARNLEFIRDKAAFGWNFVFPVLIVLGFAYGLENMGDPKFKAGIFLESSNESPLLQEFIETKHIDFVKIVELKPAIDKIRHHQLDLLVEERNGRIRFWSNSSSSKGYLLERLLEGAVNAPMERLEAEGKQISYAEWLLPGVLAMNIMFGAFFGVGLVIVRYRKTGVLKRLKATPLGAFEFLAAQLASRLFLTYAVTTTVYFVCFLVLDIKMEGSYFDLLIILGLGSISLIAIGLIIAAVMTSEEATNGVLNLISFPMMLLSGVWFSLEGTTPTVKIISNFFPLTHFINGARAIMLDGATLWDLRMEVIILSGSGMFLLLIGALVFRWEE